MKIFQGSHFLLGVRWEMLSCRHLTHFCGNSGVKEHCHHGEHQTFQKNWEKGAMSLGGGSWQISFLWPSPNSDLRGRPGCSTPEMLVFCPEGDHNSTGSCLQLHLSIPQASESRKSGTAAAARIRATAAVCPSAKLHMMAGMGEREESPV